MAQTPDEADAEVASWLAELDLDPAFVPDETPSATAAGESTPAVSPEKEPVVAAELVVACSELDAAAAQARLAQGQQFEPPTLAPPAPGMAPGL